MLLFLMLLLNAPEEQTWSKPLADLGSGIPYAAFMEQNDLISVATDGTMLIVNNPVSLVLIGPDGKLVKNIGGQGEGPGEFSRILNTNWIPSLNQFAVFDRKAGKFSFFDLKGEYKGDKRVGSDVRDPIFLDKSQVVYLNRGVEETATEMKHQAASINLENGEESAIYSATVPLVTKNLPWTPRLTFGANAEILAANFGGDRLLKIVDVKTKKVLKSLPLQLPAVELSDDSWEEFRVLMTGMGGGAEFAKLERPKYWATAKRIIVDPNGQIWVFGPSPDLVKETAFVVYDKAGQVLQTGTTPGLAQAIQGGFMYSVVSDNDGNITLHKKALPAKK